MLTDKTVSSTILRICLRVHELCSIYMYLQNNVNIFVLVYMST